MDYEETALRILEIGERTRRAFRELIELILTEQYKAEKYWEED